MDRKPVDERIGQFKDVEDQIRARWRKILPVLNERQRRLWAAAEAQTFPKSGAAIVARATGLGHRTIRDGMGELEELAVTPPVGRPQDAHIRRPGAGRKPVEQHDPTLLSDLDALVEPTKRGDPESPLRWTTRSLRNLAAELRTQGHSVSPTKVGQLLKECGYSLQANKKTVEGAQHPDRDAQFHHINDKVAEFAKAGAPIVSVDTKKKELVGNFKNGGREWHPAGKPPRVNVHDFPTDSLGKAIPYGVYDIVRAEAHVNVGTDHDTPAFAAASLLGWWRTMGRRSYPDATDLMIAADAGGSNAYRSRVWKLELQRFADMTGITVHVCHFPPGTSKWNKIEHALFSAISQNWRGRPLETYETVVNLISATTNSSGLRVSARLDKRSYPTGQKVSRAEFAAMAISRDAFHGDWNYVLSPRPIAYNQ